MKKYLVLIIMSVLVLTGCGKKELLSYEYKTYKDGNEVKERLNYYESNKMTNYVKISTSEGDIFVELYPDTAPITVSNFKSLVKLDFYKDMIFHRVIKDFMIQSGDPTGTGTGGASKKIKGEFKENGVENNLSHTRGVISMARSQENNSASSQFFIMHKDNANLDGKYASFGKVIAGLEVVDKIATTKTDKNDKPITDQKLNNITFISIQK